MIQYEITIDPLFSPCSQPLLLCAHKLFVLITIFKLCNNLIKLFHVLKKHFYENMINPNINDILLNISFNKILNDECCICLHNLLDKKDNIC